MAENSIERLRYYQGQFLRAQDFRDEQTYQRDKDRRHNLGPHTWGIVLGLELSEQDQEGGNGKDIYVLPGLAVDGYGREVLVSRQHKVDSSDFIRFASDDHYEVWIAYEEEVLNRVERGYGGCDEQGNRARETFRIFVEPEAPQPGAVMVDGQEAKPPVDADDPSRIPPDLSVPYQELPGDARQRWMIRLGSVRWDGSQFVAATEGKLEEGRQYVSAVAGAILAPAGKLTLRDRYTVPLTESDAGAAVTVEGSLEVLRDITAKADLHIDGGMVDFRQSDGGEGAEFAIQRAETGTGDDLRLRIGAEQNGDNRLAVGPQTGETADTFLPVLVVVDNGTVGVQAEQPEHPLQVGDGSQPVILSVRGPELEAEAAAIAFEDSAGTSSRWFKLLYNTDANLLKVISAEVNPILSIERTTGRVGIGTDDPDRLLTLRGTEGAYLNVIGNDGAQQVLLGADSSGGIVSTMTSHDLVLRAGGNSTKMTIKSDGDVGIGTSLPHGKLQIAGGRDVDLTDDAGFLVMGEVTGLNLVLDDNEIQARDGGANSTLFFQAEGGDLLVGNYRNSAQRVVVKDSGDVGIGTTNPAARLQVMGSVLLGPVGNLFAVGAPQALRLIAGIASGSADTSGADFICNHTPLGQYTVTFNQPFITPPVVLATPRNAADDDHIIIVKNVTASSFQAEGRDVGNLTGTLQDTSFNFIALGAV